MSTSVDDETILDVLRSNDAPRMTTTEVAGHLPVTRGTTRTRLQRLADDGLLERTTEGNNVVWWLLEREGELDAWEAEQTGEEPEETEAESDAGDEESDTADEKETTDEEADEPETDETESDDDAIEVEAVDDNLDAADEAADDEPDTVDAPNESADEDATTVEVEAVSGNGSDDGTVVTHEESPELSDDDEGLRAVAAVAVGLVAILVLRRFLGDD